MSQPFTAGRRGKRKVKRGTVISSSNTEHTKNGNHPVFQPVTVSLTDMTCTLKNSEHDSPSCAYHRCKECPQAFCTQDEHAAHVRTEHAAHVHTAHGVQCARCSYVAPDSHSAGLHEQLHQSKKGGGTVFKCKSCSFLAYSKTGLTLHKRAEHVPMKYECPMCNYTSFNARHVTAHVDKVHCNPVVESADCPYCSAKYEKGLELKEHISEEHTDESQFKEFSCNLCSYVCHTNTDIVHHIKSHRAKKKLFKCDECLFISIKFDKYVEHLENIHDTTDIPVEQEQNIETEEVVKQESSNIPVIRVVQKKERDVDIDNTMYTPPTSPNVKSDPGNIFDKINLRKEDKEKVCRAVGLKLSPRKKPGRPPADSKKLRKVRSTSGIMVRKALKRCRYCTTKTMFDTLSKLREHHIKAHGFSDLGVELGGRQYKCKYCLEKREFEGLQGLKEHYAKFHPSPDLNRKLIKRSKSHHDTPTSPDRQITSPEPAKPEPEPEPEQSSGESTQQDMLDHILKSQKQIGKTLNSTNPECTITEQIIKSRVNRMNSAPCSTYDRPPSVKLSQSSPGTSPFKPVVGGSAPPTPQIIAPTVLEDKTSPKLPTSISNSIYNLSLAELQYLQQYYVYQAYCMNKYYSDPIYRQYVHDKQGLPDPKPETPSSGASAILTRPLVKVSDPRSLAQSSAGSSVGLELTKPQLSASPRGPTKTHVCFAAGCGFQTSRIFELRNHVTEVHNIRITTEMMAELEEQIQEQESVLVSQPRHLPNKKVPNVTVTNQTYRCTHCSYILHSFDSYVQHMIDAHRGELGIVSQGHLPNTFNTQFTKTSPTKAAPKQSAGASSSSSNQFECTACYYVGESVDALRKHEKVHENTIFKCNTCDFKTHASDLLSEHLTKHAGP